jgi:Sulfotransferase domain
VNESFKCAVETLADSWTPSGSRPIELVFRTCGETTEELALELALKHIQPDRTHVIRTAKPGRLAVRAMLEIDYRCSQIVSVDSNCLVLESLRPFLDANELPYVGCYGHDRFRGRAPCGVNITRMDVVRAMRSVFEPVDNLAFTLYPEVYLRGIALRKLGFGRVFKNFHILSDYFQRLDDIYLTNALWGLRNRAGLEKESVASLRSGWREGPDFDIARHALDHVANALPPHATPSQFMTYLRGLESPGQDQMQKPGSNPGHSDQISIQDVEEALANDRVALGRSPKKPKVFGLGLSRTGTHSLTAALHVLGYDTVHYPTDRKTLETLLRGDGRFPLLEHYDGITDITTAPYYEDLDREWPGSKFVLTVRDEESWSRSCYKHWASLSSVNYGEDEEHRVLVEVRRFLEAAVYASYEFDEQHFRRVYRRYIQNVTSYFAGRESDLLTLNIVAGEGYERLAPFLGVSAPTRSFPHEGTKGKGKSLQ